MPAIQGKVTAVGGQPRPAVALLERDFGLLAGVYGAVPKLFQEGRIDCNLALAIGGSFDHRRINAAHLDADDARDLAGSS